MSDRETEADSVAMKVLDDAGVPDVSSDTCLADLDAVQVFCLVSALERVFNVELQDDLLRAMSTVGDLSYYAHTKSGHYGRSSGSH